MIRLILFASGLLFVFACCSGDGRKENQQPMVRQDINTVKEAHTRELMSIPGVIGVYIGALNDSTPCIGVMVVKKTPELAAKIPSSLGGYPVRIDETGVIKPMKGE